MGNATEQNEGQAVEVVGQTRAGVAGLAALPEQVQKFLASARDGAGMTDEDAELTILSRILMADDLAGILAEQDVAHAKDYINNEFVIHSYRWQSSDFAEGVGAYMILDVSDDHDAERFPMTCGSKTVMAQVFTLAEHGFLPCKVTLTQADKPTKAGFFPLRLTLPEEPFAAE